jgi:hypothetical protein
VFEYLRRKKEPFRHRETEEQESGETTGVMWPVDDNEAQEQASVQRDQVIAKTSYVSHFHLNIRYMDVRLTTVRG